jgi:YidC/Oxa1 family membrane protein insertase
MKVLKPEINELNEKFKSEPLKKQQAVMELYKRAGVNPFAGCIPVLLQMPILIALFRFFPASIELRQQSFLWADDLSTYDSIFELPFSIPFYGEHVSLFTILMAISIFFYSKATGQIDTTSKDPMAVQMRIMMYIMPFMMLFFFNNYSAGLSYYYLVANLITIGQTWAIRKWVINEAAIHQQIQENKKKPIKKSSFQQRLEDMSKQRALKKK